MNDDAVTCSSGEMTVDPLGVVEHLDPCACSWGMISPEASECRMIPRAIRFASSRRLVPKQ